MDLSIVIPVYNGQDCIRRSLDSILSLHMPSQSLEVIVVDDCSTDNTLCVLKEYAGRHEEIHYISLPVNKKPGGARNAGIKLAMGNYIMFLDSDDTAEQGLPEALSYAMDKGVDMLLCHRYDQRRFNDPFKNVHIDMPQHQPFSGRAFLDDYYVVDTMGSCSSYLYKSSFLKQLGHVFEEGLFFEDVDWVEHVLFYCPVIEYDTSVIFSYYSTPGSVLHTMNITKEADVVLYCCRRMAFAYSVREDVPRFYKYSLSHQGWIASIIKFRHLTTFDHGSVQFFYNRIREHQGFSWLRQLKWNGFAKLFVFYPKWALALIDFCRPLLQAGRWLVHSVRKEKS